MAIVDSGELASRSNRQLEFDGGLRGYRTESTSNSRSEHKDALIADSLRPLRTTYFLFGRASILGTQCDVNVVNLALPTSKKSWHRFLSLHAGEYTRFIARYDTMTCSGRRNTVPVLIRW